MKVGRGDITRWIADRLNEGAKSRYELTLGCKWPAAQVGDALSRLVGQGAVRARGKKEPRGLRGHMAAVYELRKGVEIAESVSRPSRRRTPIEQITRGLEDSWHAIVAR